MSHLSKTLITGFSLVLGLLSGAVAMDSFKHDTHDISEDLYYDLWAYGSAGVAVVCIAVFAAFAYRMNNK